MVYTYFHLDKNIYATYFNEQIILLDCKNNKYIVFREEAAKLLNIALKNKFMFENNYYKLCSNVDNISHESAELNRFIENLIKLNILKTDYQKAPSYSFLFKRNSLPGIESIDWNLPK